MYTENKNYGNYKACKFTLTNVDNYIKYFGYGNHEYDWLFMASKTGNSQNSFVDDYFVKTTNLNGYKTVVSGGWWNAANNAGGFCCSAYVLADNYNRAIGGRSIYIPQSV
jgi:hypothetical protein